MSDISSPLIALVQLSYKEVAGTLKAALNTAVRNGIPTENFRFSTFNSGADYLQALANPDTKFDGAVIFYDDSAEELLDDKFQEIIFKSAIYGVHKFVVVYNFFPDFDKLQEDYGYFSDFMHSIGFYDDDFSYSVCPVSDFLSLGNAEKYLNDMRPLLEDINNIIIKPFLNPKETDSETDEITATIFSRLDGERLQSDTRVTVKIAGEEYLALLKVENSTVLSAVYSTVHLSLISPVPYVRGQRIALFNRATGNIMGVGTVL